jgi:hypothetical protein
MYDCGKYSSSIQYQPPVRSEQHQLQSFIHLHETKRENTKHNHKSFIFLLLIEAMDVDDDDLFRCAVCGISEGDSSNFTQSNLQTNAAVGCGHQL